MIWIMARRRTMKKKTRRKKQGLNLVNTAQSFIIMNAATRAFFGLDAVAFATNGWLTKPGPSGSLSNPGGANSWGITAKELVQGFTNTGMGYGQSGSGPWTNDGAGLRAAIMNNLKYQGPQAFLTMVATPIAFRVGKQLTAKPRRDANKLLKMAGLSTVVKV